MSEQHRRFPENLVTAVLYRAALPEIDDKDLTLVLGQAAQTSEFFARSGKPAANIVQSITCSVDH